MLPKTILAAAFASFFAFTSQPASAGQEDCQKALGETIYVPAFSHIHTHEQRSQSLASTLVVHNTDPAQTITIAEVTLFDEAGEQVRSFPEVPRVLEPFASANFLTEITDDRGGIGANYLVVWTSGEPTCSPIALTVMIGGSGTHGISFALKGRVISRELPDAE